MKAQLEVCWRNIKKRKDVQKLIHDKITKLEQVCSDITSYRIVVEKPQKHQESGRIFQVRLDICVPPGNDLVVKKDAGKGEMDEDLEFVIHRAFDTARRQLKKIVKKQRERS